MNSLQNLDRIIYPRIVFIGEQIFLLYYFIGLVGAQISLLLNFLKRLLFLYKIKNTFLILTLLILISFKKEILKLKNYNRLIFIILNVSNKFYLLSVFLIKYYLIL